MITTTLFWLSLVFVVLFGVLLWLTESKKQRRQRIAKRLRTSGLTYRQIAAQLQVSPSTAARYAKA